MMEEKQEIPGKQLVGERIQVPVPEKEKEPAALRQKKGKKPVTTRKKIHVVRKGDTLYALALRHKTTVKKIMAANRLKSDKLALEQKLLIP
jgi:LysM repeat protein